MPTYSYACTVCENRFDIVQSFSEDSLTVCNECGGRLRKLFNSVGIVFKGSGFYRTDSRAGSVPSGSSESGSGSEGSGSDKSGSEGSGSGKSGSEGPGGSASGSSESGGSGSKSSDSSSSTAPAKSGSSAH